MLCVYRGFDGLDVSFAARIDHAFCAALETAKEKAQQTRHPAHLIWCGVSLEVEESGARGGFAFRCRTGGELGIIWFFKRPTRGDPWGIWASCRSFGLATKGLGGMRAELYSTMAALGVLASVEGESIARVDYALDILVPDFRLDPHDFVMHSNANRADHIEDVGVNGRSGRVSSVTVGKMPGRQIIVYDKRAEVLAKGKLAWWTIWDAALKERGHPPLNPEVPSESAIWRIELRAGKKHLKENWDVRRWSDLDRRLGTVATAMLKAIRHTSPNADSNRSRWPDSELWQLAHGQVQSDLAEMSCSVAPDLVKQVQLDAHDKLLAKQMAGLLATRAALHQLPIDELPRYALTVGEELGEYVSANLAHFDEKLATAKGRYQVS